MILIPAFRNYPPIGAFTVCGCHSFDRFFYGFGVMERNYIC